MDNHFFLRDKHWAIFILFVIFSILHFNQMRSFNNWNRTCDKLLPVELFLLCPHCNYNTQDNDNLNAYYYNRCCIIQFIAFVSPPLKSIFEENLKLSVCLMFSKELNSAKKNEFQADRAFGACSLHAIAQIK